MKNDTSQSSVVHSVYLIELLDDLLSAQNIAMFSKSVPISLGYGLHREISLNRLGEQGPGFEQKKVAECWFETAFGNLIFGGLPKERDFYTIWE